jgi:hypothetical protein
MAKPLILMRHPAGKYVFVKTGFCWPAFFLGTYWVIVKRAWILILPFIGIEIALWMWSGYAEQGGNASLMLMGAVVAFAFAGIRGWYGNRWLLSSLGRRGFKRVEESVTSTSLA